MRSQYAAEDEETFVSLKFSEREEIYEITRSPSYIRVSKRKNKNGEYSAIQVPAKASLILPDGLEYAGNLRDINQKIQEIIGVDQNQFSQIAMIAQGDYLRLLHASSKERKEIFSRIFNTGIYSRIQMKLKEQNNLLYGKLEDNRKLCFHQLQNMELLEDSIHLDSWKELLEFKETKTKAIREILALVLEEFRERGEALGREKEDRETLLGVVEGRLSRAEEVNRLFDGLEQAGADLKLLEEQKERWQGVKDRLHLAGLAEKAGLSEARFLDKSKEYLTSLQRRERLEQEWTALNRALLEAEKAVKESREASSAEASELSSRITRLEDIMPLYGLWKESETVYLSRKMEEEHAEKYFQSIEAELTVLKERLSANEARQAQLEEKARQLPEARQRKSGFAERQQALSELETAIRALESGLIKLEAHQAQVLDADEACKQAENTYNHMYREFLAAQAGIMAEKLADGQPCPVCGSPHHPHRAELAQGAVTQDQAEQAKKIRERAEEKRGKAAEESIRALERCRHQKEQIDKEARKWLGGPAFPEPLSGQPSGDSIDRLKGKLSEETEHCSQALAAADKAEKEALEADRLLSEILEARKADRKQQEKLEPERERAGIDLQEKRVEAATCQVKAEKLKESLPFPDEKSASEELIRLNGRREALLKAEADAEERRRKVLEESREKKGRLDSEAENGGSLRLASEEAEKAYHSAIRDLGFSDEEDYRGAKQTPETMKQWEEEVQDYEKALEKARIIYHQYKKQTEGREWIETGRWKEEAAFLREEQKRLQNETARLTGLFSRAVQTEENLKRLWKEREDLEEEYSLYHNLFQTANGKMTGSVSLDFQTYVQRQYFNQMIQAANRRLKVMTDGQFLLQCRDLDALGKQGEVGLDLDVYTMATDRLRDIKTLSGGESFMAALAMALGMADIIQRTAGNVSMDALFIDEGFGSLDEESRLKAVRILQELAGGRRLVGIISHVTELKEQIGKKLTVRKTEKGSRIQWDLESP